VAEIHGEVAPSNFGVQLNVAMFYRFSLHLHGLLEDKSILPKKIVLYSSEEHDKRANAALLIACYAVRRHGRRWVHAEGWSDGGAALVTSRSTAPDSEFGAGASTSPGVPAQSVRQRPFRDAGYARADFHLSVQDCLFGIKKAVDLRLLRLDEFDVKEYEHYEKVENGDWNVGSSSDCLAGPLTQAAVCQPAFPCLCVARRGALQPDRLPQGWESRTGCL
jgi:cell division cycle 14